MKNSSNVTRHELGVETKSRPRFTMQDLGDWWTVGILLSFIIVFSIIAQGFFTLQNFVSTTVYASTTLLLAMGETFVIITGGIDLSVGAILGLSGMVAGYVMEHLLPVNGELALVIGIISGLVCGIILGFINGFVISRMEVTPFIATLGMLGIATGFTFLITNGSDIVNLPQSLNVIGNGVILNFLAVPFLVTLVVLISTAYVLHKTRFGRYTYAIGSNAEGARRSGVNVKNHLLKIYTVSGFLSGVAGVLILARLVSGSPLEGQNDELNAIAAVVIGGASLFGGRGTVLGSIVGAFIITVLVVGLVITGVQPYWQTVSIGLIIIFAVYIDQRRYRHRTMR
jgi:ribose transport system permease protein